MRIYVSNGRVYAAFDEPIELRKFDNLDALQRSRDILLEKISKKFDRIITEAALKGLETPEEHPAEHDENAEVISEPQEDGTKQPKELFREPKDGTLKPEGKKTRQRLDYGKIMALHNAGWSNAKIADEMGMTYAAVATAISTYKKKMRVGGGNA